ncbi:unnamed protein product [Rotaria sp. Silwood2]|nr:unnamed protein product [Rotaria sp. Silwood2]
MECENKGKEGDENDVEDDDDIRTFDDDEDEVDDNYNDGNRPYINHPSTSCLKRPSDGFSTSALKRSYNKFKASSQSSQRRNRDRSLQNDSHRESNITDTHDLSAKNSYSHYPNKMTGNVSRSIYSSQDDHPHSNTNVGNTDPSLIINAETRNDQLSSYRDENDKENYRDTIPWNDKNLLQITARDIGDYGRKILDALFTEKELQSSILPSPVVHLYDKDALDEERFKILNAK